MSLQDLPLDILLEIARFHPWVSCELSKTVRKVGLASLENNVKIWFKLEKQGETFILAKSARKPYYRKLYHSWDDKPAEIEYDGVQTWYKLGKRHRDNDKPAVIHSDGTQEWYKEDELQRDDDKPAVTFSDGTQWWYKKGNRHRDGDKPAIICADGTQKWYKEGKRYYPA